MIAFGKLKNGDQIYSIYVTFFSTWPLFLKFDRDRFLGATFLLVLSFLAGGLPYFGTLFRQTVDSDSTWVAIPKMFFKQSYYFIDFFQFCFKIVFNKEGFLACI